MPDERIIAYLLEELPEKDMERFDDECFAQESRRTEIELVESDLIDAYLRGELTPERRQRFERNYLTPEREERVIMAAALLRLIDQYNSASKSAAAVSPPEQTWAERSRAFWSSRAWPFRTAAAIATVAVIAFALWLFFSRASSLETFATLTLTISNSSRAEGAQSGKVKLPPDTAILNISLTLPQQSPPAAGYRVELENDNAEAKSAKVSGSDARSVLVVVPAEQLAREQYALKLFAIKADGTEQRINGSYFFTVE
jgi:methionine-rich copper-binding protein CopC